MLNEYQMDFEKFSRHYFSRLKLALDNVPLAPVQVLAEQLILAWKENKKVFIFGNGGSAGNAIHLANDFLYGVSREVGHALRVTALPANSAVITCLANDEGFETVFSRQLAVLADPGDIAIAFSGSGNSPNILEALEYCSRKKIKTFAILGYTGGRAKLLADYAIHVQVDDMQISEDVQLILGHMLMQWLSVHKDKTRNPAT
jgi:D-sedoheptulose 7-phosphate isomerase